MRVLKKLIHHPVTFILLWVLFLLYPLVSVVRYNYLTRSSYVSTPIRILLSLTYKAYGPLFLLLSLVIVAVWIRRFFDKKFSRKYLLALLAVASISVIFNIVAGQLLGLDVINYPNYLYSTYGLRPQDLEFVRTANYIIFGLIAGYFSVEVSGILKRGINRGKITDTKILLTTLGVVILVIQSFYPFSNIRTILRIPKEDFKTKLGWRYIYVEKLVETVPEDAKIIHPPQGSKWPEVGNQPIIRYFLFPRTLISGALVDNQAFAEEIGKAYFPEIGDPPWPEIDKVNQTIIFNEKDPVHYKELKRIPNKADGLIYKIIFK